MFYSESEKYVIVPLASNIFFQESKLNRKYMGFAKEYFNAPQNHQNHARLF